jgi:hypothetical protein
MGWELWLAGGTGVVHYEHSNMSDNKIQVKE